MDFCAFLVVNIGFGKSSVTVREDSRSFNVCVLKNETKEEISVQLSVKEGSAKNQTGESDKTMTHTSLRGTAIKFVFWGLLVRTEGRTQVNGQK